MTGQEKIEEIMKVLNECCNVYDENGRHIRNKCNKYDCEYWSDTNHCCCSYGRKEAECIYNAGYRRVDEVRKETAREILEKAKELRLDTANANCLISEMEIWIKEQFGVEVGW